MACVPLTLHAGQGSGAFSQEAGSEAAVHTCNAGKVRPDVCVRGNTNEALNDEIAYINNRNNTGETGNVPMLPSLTLLELVYRKLMPPREVTAIANYNPYFSPSVIGYYRFLFRLTPF